MLHLAGCSSDSFSPNTTTAAHTTGRLMGRGLTLPWNGPIEIVPSAEAASVSASEEAKLHLRYSKA